MIFIGQLVEVLLGGLLAGVLYSLVAFGFVLIYKASRVFNFAQGAMVLLATVFRFVPHLYPRSMSTFLGWGRRVRGLC